MSFRLGGAKKKKKTRAARYSPNLLGVLKVLIVVGIFAAVAAGFFFLERYVKRTGSVGEKVGFLELVNPPGWVNQTLREKIIAAAETGGEDLKIDEDAALSVQQNLESQVAWLDEVRVQTIHESFLVRARWRKPLALVKLGLRKFYVDADMVVLDFVPMPNLPIISVQGLSLTPKLPLPGDVWQRDDLAAAVVILAQFDRMDKLVTPDKPLLYEIDRLDISNFNGRQNSRFPHIVLYTKDDTEITWGAEMGAWQRHLEATDEEKLAKLYSFYKEYGSLLGGVKYINLRDPQNNVPQPIDKY